MHDRSSQRRRVLKSCKLELAGGGAFDATLRNMSGSGAAIEVASPIGIPEHFMLVIPNEIRKPCHVVWRKESRIGVAFA